MFVRGLSFYAACVSCWLFILPVMAVGCALGLIAYAIVTATNDWLIGRSSTRLDRHGVRELARQICTGC